MRARLPMTALAAAALLALGAAPPAEEANVPDRGVFTVFLNDQPVGTESFDYIIVADSLFVQSEIRMIPPGADADADTLLKAATLVANAADYDLHTYLSTTRLGERKTVRALTFEDTVFTAIREAGEGGTATLNVRPPGKVFVIDPQVFTMFDVICRNMHGRTFQSRSIHMIVLGARDSVKQGTVEDLGSEEIRWGARPVTARKLAISDEQVRFIAWVSPIGRMLRLEAPDAGLRVEREPPPLKRRAPPPGG